MKLNQQSFLFFSQGTVHMKRTEQFHPLLQHSWLQDLLCTEKKKKIHPEIVLRIQRTVRVKLLYNVYIGESIYTASFTSPSVVKGLFKWLGIVHTLASPTSHRLTDFLCSLLPPHRIVVGISHILIISAALMSETQLVFHCHHC